ncbi:5-oxoprolinase subunit PxpA [Hirschia baltica]|uniref:LamB/YcsF family protein n=1 Tax=Hirschia baltica (strain ATCC 49814 / DSM 5838 / IFAM 1418) TaxID=582402 RepID=C6XL46_HIRBI|nr:5-oxoprolinase subunit PxpA [Hirschia baltica]ACT57875.1 LamB/YcsF family protein [Hirschia baltica ATCC 49814]
MAMTRMIDLNADLGEGCATDVDIMPYISSCNIACGGHTGDRESIAEAMTLAKLSNVRIGAHPSYPDRENFGRKPIEISDYDLETSLRKQLHLIKNVAADMGVPIVHVKPHGALYNEAANSEKLSWNIVNIVREVLPHAAIMGLPDCKLEQVAKQHKRTYITEGFADRRYDDAGKLVSRANPDAVINDNVERCGQALALAQGAPLQTLNGNFISMKVDSICLHGDSKGAVQSAQSINRALTSAHFTVQAHIHGA